MAPPEWNFGHVAGTCDVSFIGTGDETRLVTCGADGAVHVRDPETPADVEESFTDDHQDAVNVLAVAPDGKTFATGSDDYFVKLFSWGVSREFESNVVRFTQPVRALAYSADGALLAAGGEDSSVKVINVSDKSVAHELPVRSKCVKSVAFDPRGEYLSAVDDAGALTVWALKAVAAADAADADDDAADASVEPGDVAMHATVAPVTEPDAPATNRASWRPDGAVLAAPGRERDVTFFERGTWTELEDHRLMAPEDAGEGPEAGHAGDVAFVAWSPNGKYLFTAGSDDAACVWDVAAKKVVGRIKHDTVVCGAAWRAEGNALALVDANGQWAVWKNPVPGSMKSPTEAATAEELDFFAAGKVAGAAAADEDDAEMEEDDEDGLGDMDEEEYYGEMERRRRMKRKAAAAAAKNAPAPGIAAAPAPQPPFQVGSVPASGGKNDGDGASGASRRFLCYNMMGTVITTGEAGSDFNSVEMAFHDTSRAGRIPTITDYHGYNIGVLGERGCALASPGKSEGGAATVFYRPYESWAHTSEWRVTLPAGERATSLAAGATWVAALTSARMLRVFSHAGAQRQMVQLEGAPVTCAGKGESLVVVWHAAAPALVPGVEDASELRSEQRLEFAEYDLSDGGRVLNRGRVPVPPGHTLTWLGHVEDGTGALAFGSSDGVVRVRVSDFGGSWVPVFRSADARAQEGEHHWTVAVSAADTPTAAAGLYCVVCRTAAGPNVHPKPVLTPLPLSMPVALPEASSGELEDVAAKARLSVALVTAAANGLNAAVADDADHAAALAAAHAAADKAALRLFHAACKGERPARAADVAAGLHLSNSMHGALKLANALQQPVLAQRVTGIIEASMAAAAAAAAAEHSPTYAEPSQLDTPGQAPHAHYSAPASYAPPSQSQRGVKAEEENPFARRKSVGGGAAAADENDAGNVDDRAAATKTKAGFERDANPAPAKKGRAANPFARK